MLWAFAVRAFADDTAPDKSAYDLFNPTPDADLAASTPIDRRSPTFPIRSTPATFSMKPISPSPAMETPTASRLGTGPCSI
jgi:hypothetical protein